MKYLIIHGHFYQPPREDPFLGIVPQEPSASPSHDWNERIMQECYSPNAYSRVLDEYGRITKMVNNYEFLSFNFGPTLLDYIAEKRPDVLEKIIEADKESIKRLGYGNALAQVYNHIILPLAKKEDMIVEIKWGIYNFKKYFNRAPSGMWLSETAINIDTVDALYECGIKFTVLSPYQAHYVKALNGKQEDVSDAKIDTSKPYWVYGTNGRKIIVFFYDAYLSQSVAFEHLLTSVDKLSEKINGSYQERNMTNIATDGESYGHHEAFADMCLSRFFIETLEKKSFTISNYEHYMNLFPPKDEVVLHLGEGGRGTSWSCAHGVERWRSNCGCGRNGNLSLEWRKSLREAFDLLRDMQDKMFNALINFNTQNRLSLRESYVAAIYDDLYAKNLYEICDKSVTYEEFRFLMESYKYSLFAYTSCAWFFSDVSGIEPRKVMQYAEKSFYYAKNLDKARKLGFVEETHQKFLSILEHSVSNLEPFSTAREIYEQEIKPNFYSEKHIINQFAFSVISDINYEKEITISHFTIKDFTISDKEINGTIAHKYGYHKYFSSKIFEENSELKNMIQVADTQNGLAESKVSIFSLKNVIADLRYPMAEELFANEINYVENSCNSILPAFESVFEHYNKNDVIPNHDYRRIMGALYSPILRGKIKSEGRDAYDYVTEKLTQIRNSGIFISTSGIASAITDNIREALKEMMNTKNTDLLDNLLKDIKFSSKNDMPIERHSIENTFYQIVIMYKNGEIKMDDDEQNMFMELGSWINFNMKSILAK